MNKADNPVPDVGDSSKKHKKLLILRGLPRYQGKTSTAVLL